MFVMAMVFVSVFVLMAMIVVHIAYCIVQLLWWAAACSSCVVNCLAIVVGSGLPLLCCEAAYRSCAVQRIASRVLGGGLPFRCSALYYIVLRSGCRSFVVQLLASRVLGSGLPLVSFKYSRYCAE
jgi:hypothetical protein